MLENWLNFGLLKNPLNWVIVVLMMILAFLPFALLHERVHGKDDAK
jgi:hypothetical protein